MADIVSSQSQSSQSQSSPTTNAAQDVPEQNSKTSPDCNPTRQSTSSSAANVPAQASSRKKPTYNYLTLAQKLGNEPGFAIFRRFATLNAKNLLYLQAELTLLEDELDYLEYEDQEAEDETRRNYQWEARLLMEHLEDKDNNKRRKEEEEDEDEDKEAKDKTNTPNMKNKRKTEQWKKMLEIRSKLKEYNEALLTHRALHALPRPNTHDLRILRRNIEWPWYGDSWMELPESVYRSPGDDPEPADDLVALSTREVEGDRFSRWFTDKFVPWMHRHVLSRPARRRRKPAAGMTDSSAEKGKPTNGPATGNKKDSGDGDGEDIGEEEGEETQYSDRILNRLVLSVTLLVSSLLPTVSIIVLNYIQPTIWRLVFTLFFSIVFNVCLAVFTAAKRSEIFAATVGLASVQVVFIGTTTAILKEP